MSHNRPNHRKVDNYSLPTKVALRRRLLSAMGFEEVRVLDTCVGHGKIWEAMADHVHVRQWTKCDVKPKRPDALALSALEAIQKFEMDLYNVVDIDPYGCPFEAFHALLPRLVAPTAVFLTRGQMALGRPTKYAAVKAGIPASWYELIPHGLAISDLIGEMALSEAKRHVEVRYAWQAKLESLKSFGGTNITYWGLGLYPR